MAGVGNSLQVRQPGKFFDIDEPLDPEKGGAMMYRAGFGKPQLSRKKPCASRGVDDPVGLKVDSLVSDFITNPMRRARSAQNHIEIRDAGLKCEGSVFQVEPEQFFLKLVPIQLKGRNVRQVADIRLAIFFVADILTGRAGPIEAQIVFQEMFLEKMFFQVQYF